MKKISERDVKNLISKPMKNGGALSLYSSQDDDPFETISVEIKNKHRFYGMDRVISAPPDQSVYWVTDSPSVRQFSKNKPGSIGDFICLACCALHYNVKSARTLISLQYYAIDEEDRLPFMFALKAMHNGRELSDLLAQNIHVDMNDVDAVLDYIIKNKIH